VFVYNPINPAIQFSVTNLQDQGATVSFNVNLKPGTYAIKYFTLKYGYATITDTLTVSPTSTTYSVTSGLKMSYAGGYIEIEGENINDAAMIRVGNFEGALQTERSNATHGVFKVPALLTS